MVREDRGAKVDSPVTATGRPLVTIPITARQVSDDSDVCSTTTTTTIVPLSSVPDEKLRLLEKLARGGRVTLGGVRVAVDVPEKRLCVDGSAQQVQTATTNALEALTLFCSDRAGVSRRQLELLVSDRGQRWLDELLARSGGPTVVLFARDTMDYVVAADRDAISQVSMFSMHVER